jgi:hypothetical protein
MVELGCHKKKAAAFPQHKIQQGNAGCLMVWRAHRRRQQANTMVLSFFLSRSFVSAMAIIVAPFIITN